MHQLPHADVAPFWPETMPGPFTNFPREAELTLIAPHLVTGGERPMVIFDDGVELTCAEFKQSAERLAAGLSTRVSPGDRVGVAIGNRAEFLIAYFAIIVNRAVAVLISPDIRDAEAAHIVADMGLTLAFAEPDAADVLDRVGRSQVTVLRVASAAPEPHGLAAFYGESSIPFESVTAMPSDVIDIGYTSGTTGLPKAMEFNHDEKLRYADIFLRTFPFSAGDRILCPLHFHYGDPLWLLLVSVLRHTPMVVMRKFSVSRFWAVAKRFEVTHLMSIGAIPSLLLRAAPSPAERDHRISFALAVGVPKAQHAELVERFGFHWIEMYGTSETGPAIAMPVAFAERYVGTGALGIPYPEVDARLVGSDDVTLDGPATGDLEIAGEFVPFQGYLDNPEATAEMLRDGWIRTGDLMRRDEHGVYYFMGRRKELIRRGGENIAPAQIEDVLRSHPAVIDAAVVPVPDPVRNEEVKAYVQVRRDVDPAELAEHCAQNLAPFKVPRYIELRTDAFPRTPSQRIRKSDLEIDGAHQTAGAWDRTQHVGGTNG